MALLLVQFISQLVLARVIHRQNMWNLLREIADEVLRTTNSSNRRDAYCYMVLESLLIVGLEMQRLHDDVKAGKEVLGKGAPANTGPLRHRPVDLPALFEDASYYIRNRPPKESDDSTLGATWKKALEYSKEGWMPCQAALLSKPYMDPELQSKLPRPSAYHVLTLKRTLMRSTVYAAQPPAQGPDQNPLEAFIGQLQECKRRGHFEDAHRMWGEARLKGDPRPDMAAYLAILSVCAARGDVARARLYWDQMLLDGLVPSLKGHNAYLSVLARAGDVDMFLWVDTMIRSGIRPDLATFTALALGCEQMESPDRATALLGTMREHGVEPDGAFLAILIKTCKVGGNLNLCTSLWTKLTRDYGVEPDKAAYKAVEQVFRIAAKTNIHHFRTKTLAGLPVIEGQVETLSFKVPVAESPPSTLTPASPEAAGGPESPPSEGIDATAAAAPVAPPETPV